MRARACVDRAEEAIEDGRLAPGATGWRRRRAQVVNAALLERWDDDGVATCLDAVHAERLERWLERGPRRGSERSAIVASAAATLAADAPAVRTGGREHGCRRRAVAARPRRRMGSR